MKLDVSTGFCVTTWTGFWQKRQIETISTMTTEISKWIVVAAAIEKTMIPQKN